MNEDKKIKWVLVILLVCFIIGVFGMYIYQKNRYKQVYFEYNGFAVHKVKNKNDDIVYQTEIFIGNNPQPYLITTRYSPKNLEDISIYEDLKKDLFKEKLYITMDPNSTAISVLAGTEISKITGNTFLYGIPTFSAFTAPAEGYNITIKTCNDVNQDQAIIYLKQSDQSKIYSENGCIIVEGKDEYDLIKVANRLILTLLKIMEV